MKNLRPPWRASVGSEGGLLILRRSKPPRLSTMDCPIEYERSGAGDEQMQDSGASLQAESTAQTQR